jgi:single-stranded DNA-binding protein
MWTGQDGNSRASYELTAETVRFIGGREESGAMASEEGAAVAGPASEEEIPF